ncbi:unnamed protein product [Sphagnum balticum]
MERARYMALHEQYAIQKLQESEKIAIRTLEEQTRHDQLRANYRNELERKRMADGINAQRHLDDEVRRKTEEALRRQEEILRLFLEHEV